MKHAHFAAQFGDDLTQAGVSREEGSSIEEMPPWDEL